MSEETEKNEVEYRPLVSFAGVYKTQAEEHAYVHGHESGEIWVALSAGNEGERTVHEENRIILQRMCDALGYTVDFQPTAPPCEGWLVATFTRLPRKKHLAVVK